MMWALIGIGWALVVLFAIALCCAAAGELSDRMLDSELPDRLFVTLDPTAGPPSERRR